MLDEMRSFEMNIGEVAALSEVNSKMIRRYEEQGIIPKAEEAYLGIDNIQIKMFIYSSL